MSEASRASPTPLSPPSPAAVGEVSSPDLPSQRNELAETREQLSQVRAQLLEVHEEIAGLRARQAQILENLNNDSEPSNTQPDVGLGIQVSPIEQQSALITPRDTPFTHASMSREQPVLMEDSPRLFPEADDDAPSAESTPTAAEENTEEAQYAQEPMPSEEPVPPEEPVPSEEPVPPADAPVEPVPPTDPDDAPPVSPPTDAMVEPPEWVDIEEDTTVPDEEELKEIEASNDTSARDVKHHEESFYAEAPEDPEQQPSQKMRLTWVIKGVRGTKEKPNGARIMNSPAVLVGGFYWYLKFFPRGNNSSALSAYVKCSRKAPKPDEEVPENTFSVVYGAPDADLGELKPVIDMSIPATDVPAKGESRIKGDELSADETSKKTSEGETMQHDESANASADTEQSFATVEDEEEDAEDWRVPAQIGIIIYNPEEPRTKFDMAACHQFNKHNDDWGWTNFHGPWSEIHKRRHGQRQALLRNDTLALDAYIRIFNDPSQALWWHHCTAEEQWDSVSLTGFPALGTKSYHTPGVAGITSWLLLAPFRRIFQSFETDSYRKDSHVPPQSLCSQLQMILYLMRKQKQDEKYVSLEAIVEIMDKLDESGTDVVTFWEGFRRSLELELQTNPSAINELADIFDSKSVGNADSVPTSPLRIPVEDMSSVQHGIERVFSQIPARQHFPKFLTIELERQKFDTVIREWKLLYDRVRLSEELDLSQWSAEPEASKYTLYGFVVHAEERNSGKFYSILRPNGPGSKWLAFEDGTSNQVISYTKHRIQEFEGLEGDALKENKTTRQTAYLAMYIRTDVLQDFLPGTLEPYELSPWLKNCPQVKDYLESKDVQAYEDETRSEVKLEIYTSQRVKGRHGLVDIQDLKDVQTIGSKDSPQHLTVPAETTYQELRHKLAKWNEIDNVEKIKLWTIQPPSPGAPLNFSFKRMSRLYKTVLDRDCATRSLCIWMHVLRTDDEVKSFGDPEPPVDHDVFDRTITENRAVDPDVPEASQSAVEVAAEPDIATNEVVEMVGAPEPNAPPHDDTIPTEDTLESEELSTNNTAQATMAVEGQPVAPENLDEPTSVNETEETPTSIPVASVEAITPTVPDQILDTAQVSSDQNEETQAQSIPAAYSVSAEEALFQSTAEEPPSALISAEDEYLIAALIAQDLESLDGTIEDNGQVDVVAGNVDPDTAGVVTDPTAANTAVEPSESPETEAPVSEQPALEATETAPPPPPVAAETTNDDAQSETSDDDEIITTRPVPFYYGLIQLFDAQTQDFLIHGDFLAQASDNVKEFVRKQLGYANDKNFLVWRRSNAYRMTSLQASSTFEDIKDDSSYRLDGFVLVVGDVLSDST